jgi:hypothetical protein
MAACQTARKLTKLGGSIFESLISPVFVFQRAEYRKVKSRNWKRAWVSRIFMRNTVGQYLDGRIEANQGARHHSYVRDLIVTVIIDRGSSIYRRDSNKLET